MRKKAGWYANRDYNILYDHIFCMIMVTNAILCPIISFCMQTERETRYCYKRTDSFQDKCLLHDQQDQLNHYDQPSSHFHPQHLIISKSQKYNNTILALVQHKGALLSSLVYIIYASDSPKHWRAYNSEWLFSGKSWSRWPWDRYWPSCLAMDRKSTCLSLHTNALKRIIFNLMYHTVDVVYYMYTHSVHFNGMRWH